MTPEEKQHLDNLFPKELPQEYTAAEKLKDAQFKIAQLEKMLSEAKQSDQVRRQFWLETLMFFVSKGKKWGEAKDWANEALEHYDKTFYGH